MSSSHSGLEALFFERKLLERLRKVIKQIPRVEENESRAITLHDCLIRLRIWKQEFFIQGLEDFEANNEELAQIVRRRLEKISVGVQEIDQAVVSDDLGAINDPLKSMQTTVSELLEISDPIITAVEIATETGHTQHLIQSIANTIKSQADTNIDSDALYADAAMSEQQQAIEDRISEYTLKMERLQQKKKAKGNVRFAIDASYSSNAVSAVSLSDATGSSCRLVDDIERKLVNSVFSKREYLPQDDLESLVNVLTIEEELQKDGIHQPRDGLVDCLATKAPKIFATLASSGLISKATSLLDAAFDDTYLPVARDGQRISSLSGLPWDHPALSWFRGWSDHDMRSFCEKQWRFLPKAFTDELSMEELHSECRLPITDFSTVAADGSYSILHKATIHRYHHKVMPGELVVAVKQLKCQDPGAEKQHEIEIDALDMARRLDHPHIVKFVGGFKQSSITYLVFQWADGGNLREYWARNSNWSRSIPHKTDLISWTIGQMLGLAEALREWHNYHPDTKMNCRHGDLKPENIVRSILPRPEKFQIADLGLAKVHSLPTHMRNRPSISQIGTSRYLSPEIRLGGGGKISRSYDMWSIGCMYLEWIIWLMYGPDQLLRFQEESFPNHSDRFFVTTPEGTVLNPSVLNWIQHMEATCLKTGNDCHSGTLRDLLVFVKERLLIEDPDTLESVKTTHVYRSSTDGTARPEVNIIPELDSSERPLKARAKSDELCEVLNKITGRYSSSRAYILDPEFEMSNTNYEGPSAIPTNTYLTPMNQMKSLGLVNKDLRKSSGRHISTSDVYATPADLDIWNTHTDDLFAKSVFSTLSRAEVSEIAPSHSKNPSSLCEDCLNPERGLFSRSSFSVTFKRTEVSREVCVLCKITYDRMAHLPGDKAEMMLLREGSSLTTARGYPPALSIVAGPTQDRNDIPEDLQRGFPILPLSGGLVQLRLMKKWIDRCDSNHKGCKLNDPSHMPLRLVDVAIRGDPNVLRLDCNTTREDDKYAALTHRWGDPKEHERFCLQTAVLENWKMHLDLNKLPQTFQDAVKVARGLDIRYIWIDTLCIIQDDKADLRTQIRTMEDIFRCAYVTLSATCATSMTDGFLKRTSPARLYHPLRIPNISGGVSPLYLCEPVDDFRADVENSELSKRGWVFQERALSRRIIHFTGNQVYWECGTGIRCESLTKLYNHKTSFLSDPRFPEAMSVQYKGMRIVFFEEIYAKYSQLDFTIPIDRAVGMAGIETRLARLYRKAQCGILDDEDEPSYLRRTLLWRSADVTQPMTKIKYPPERRIPSWSWMAVMGPICFMDIPYGAVNWITNLESPLTKDAASHDNLGALVGEARVFSQQSDDRLFFDRSDIRPSHAKLKCMVLGTQESLEGRLMTYYGLLAETTNEGSGIYERVGVATFERYQDWMYQQPVERVQIS